MKGVQWSQWHDRLHQTLRYRRLLQKHQSVLLAVSGGQDSLALAKLMVDLQPKWDWRLAIAHCNHRWRADADANARHVQTLAEDWEIPYFETTAEPQLVSEAAARNWRYGQLEAIAQTQGCSVIMTGHTASDRAETLLYNLFRGSGMDGLQALSWQRSLTPNLCLLRPLLEFSRSETGQVCRELHLPIWEDATNQDLNYARNRIRHELLPYLKTHFNPHIEQVLAQTSELLQADVAVLEASVEAIYPTVVEEPVDSTPSVRVRRSSLRLMAIALQRRTLRQFLKATLSGAPTFQDIEKLRTLVDAPNRSQSDPFVGGAIARVEGDWICLVNPSGSS